MLLKLTDENMRTYGETQWVLGEWREAPGEGPLCSAGWLHYYHGTPELAVALDPFHGNFGPGRRLFVVEIEGKTLRDGPMKAGAERLRLVEEIPVPEIARNALARWAIYCVRAIPDRTPIPGWEEWADRWLSGQIPEEAAASVLGALRATVAWASASAMETALAKATWAAAMAMETALWKAMPCPLWSLSWKRSAAEAAFYVADVVAGIDLAGLLARAIQDEKETDR